MTGQFVYVRLAITQSLIGVETEKVFQKVFRLTLQFTVIYEATKEIVAPGSNKPKTSKLKTCNVLVTTLGKSY